MRDASVLTEASRIAGDGRGQFGSVSGIVVKPPELPPWYVLIRRPSDTISDG